MNKLIFVFCSEIPLQGLSIGRFKRGSSTFWSNVEIVENVEQVESVESIRTVRVNRRKSWKTCVERGKGTKSGNILKYFQDENVQPVRFLRLGSVI